jgi:hypothetical protein
VTTLAPVHADLADRALATLSTRDRLGGGPTLDELVAGVWEGLAAHHEVPCPICGARLKPQYGAHWRPIGGRCDSCGSSLG